MSVPKKLVIFSSCLEDWGGSEILWAETAEVLIQKGYEIHIFKLAVNFSLPQIKKLLQLGCKIVELDKCLPSVLQRMTARILPHNPKRTLRSYMMYYLANAIRKIQPDLVVISQGENWDAFPFIRRLALENVPYVIVSQKAFELHWVEDWQREWMQDIWKRSERNYFVSKHNLTLTEEQFGFRFSNAEVIRNPFQVDPKASIPWNFENSETINLACVGRLYPYDKGQDMLLKVLASEKWRKRDLHVSFYGKGINEQGLKELAALLELNNVSFAGHVSDVESIWHNNQALILPARAEGLPLVLVEAMMCGRTAILTNVGGNSEVLEDNETGFISQSVDEIGIDEAMERAWQRRNEWEAIGFLAAKKIRRLVPESPQSVFAEKLEEIIGR